MMTWLMVAAGILLTLFLLGWLAWAWGKFLQSLYPERLRTQEIHTVVTHDLWKLRLCRYRKGRNAAEPILFVHGCGANQFNFTNPAGGCIVDHLVERGYDCWTVDLRGNRSSQPPFERSRFDATLDDYLLYDLPAVIRYVRQTTGFDKIHYVGHSMGGMLLYAYVQEYGGDHFATGTTLGSPIGFAGTKLPRPRVALFMIRHFPRFSGWLFRNHIPLALKLRLPSRLFPVNTRNLHKNVNAGHLYAMVEDPLPHVIDELIFCAHHRVWKMKAGTLDVVAGLGRIDIPLMAIFAPRDPFIPLDHAEAFVESLASKDKQILICSKGNGCKHDYDHCDLAFGEEGAREVFEPVHRWIAAHPIGERISKVEMGTDGDPAYRRPLDTDQRAGILSGASYAHLTNDDDEEKDLEQDVVFGDAVAAGVEQTFVEVAAVNPDEAVDEDEDPLTAAPPAPPKKTTAKKRPAKSPSKKAAKPRAAVKSKTAPKKSRTETTAGKSASTRKAATKKPGATTTPAAAKTSAKQKKTGKKGASDALTPLPPLPDERPDSDVPKNKPKAKAKAKAKPASRKPAKGAGGTAKGASAPSAATRNAILSASAELDRFRVEDDATRE